MSDMNQTIQQAIDKAKRLKENLKEIDGTHTYSFRELFDNEFMQNHTHFSTISDFITASNLDFSSAEAFSKIDKDKLDDFVSSHSNFSSWHDMETTAAKLLLSKKINK